MWWDEMSPSCSWQTRNILPRIVDSYQADVAVSPAVAARVADRKQNRSAMMFFVCGNVNNNSCCRRHERCWHNDAVSVKTKLLCRRRLLSFSLSFCVATNDVLWRLSRGWDSGDEHIHDFKFEWNSLSFFYCIYSNRKILSSFQVRPLASLMVTTGVIDLTVMCIQCFNRFNGIIKLFDSTSKSNRKRLCCQTLRLTCQCNGASTAPCDRLSNFTINWNSICISVSCLHRNASHAIADWSADCRIDYG